MNDARASSLDDLDGESGDALRSESAQNGAGIGAKAAVGSIETFAREVLAAAGTMMEVYADRAKQSLRSALAKALLGVLAAVVVVLWLGSAALACVRGICGGLQELFGGREWAGDLVGGAVAIGVVVAAVAIYQRGTDRREFLRLKSKYERMRHEADPQSQSPSVRPTEDDRGAAGSRGSVGDRARHGVGSTAG